jgi:PadR family transcriptional regulator, regulatory protein PadR
MDKEIMKGSIDILILSIINTKDTYGYEIAKEIKEKSNFSYTMGEGTLYPALKRLEEKQCIESYWQSAGLVGKRKYYKITDLGKEKLKEKLEQWSKITNLINILGGKL